MKTIIPPAMFDALRLTRSGDLVGAAALIRKSLTGAPMAYAADAPSGPVMDLTATRVTAPRPQPGGAARSQATFEERRLVAPAGTIGYRLYVPANATAGMPLVVMLHGCTQSAEDFANGTGMNHLADELGFLVAYPIQTQAANAQKCWNWFKPGDQQRDNGEPALIAGITRQVIADKRADPARVYVAGLSAGGAAAAIMGAAYPDLYAAIGVHSGLACGSARDLPSALTAMRRGGGKAAGSSAARFVPVITFHGDRDNTVNEINSREIVAAATANGIPLTTQVETAMSAGGRSYTREQSLDAHGHAMIEQWTVHGGAHAWSGGDKSGTYTDPAGPDASREMVRFFLEHRLA